ncbi:MAG: DNA gyrase inhibitor YacG [Alphaproteobacteria bacterium]|nr:MAG: DNA gyrase inhibitor YacG [Alphaproteobacteria bacterium]
MADAPATGGCPICGKPVTEKLKPFCSKRCADVDLSRWLKGTYRIPAVEPPDEWDEASQSQPLLEDNDPDATRH